MKKNVLCVIEILSQKVHAINFVVKFAEIFIEETICETI